MLVSFSAFSADLGLLGCEPPTTVNWAPRRIALGSKFDIESSSGCRESQRTENELSWLCRVVRVRRQYKDTTLVQKYYI